MALSIKDRIQRALRRLGLTRREPDPPQPDPYAYVTAPKKPRPSSRGAAAVAELPEE